jgi:hypothetical protein
MAEEFLEILKQIVSKEIHGLTEADIEFLRARKSYLSEEEAVKFAEILEEKGIETETPKEKS